MSEGQVHSQEPAEGGEEQVEAPGTEASQASLRALVLNCTLKKSPARSNTALLAEKVTSALEERGVECEWVRLVDLDVKPGVTSDEGDGDEWPGVREKILAADIVVFATPTWIGKISSVAQSALERMDAMLAEQNEAGQMILYNRVAGFVVTGNEDGAKSCISDLAAAAIELGFSVPPLAFTYWNMGPGPGPDYADTDHGHEWSGTTAKTCAHNLHHLARTLREHPFPPER